MRGSCGTGFLTGSAATPSALKPFAQWSPVSQLRRAALPRVQRDKEPLSFIKGPEYSPSDLTALTEGKCQTGKRDKLGEGKKKKRAQILWPTGTARP